MDRVMMVGGQSIKGNPRSSIGFLTDKFTHECGASCSPSCAPFTKVSHYILGEHADSCLDGWNPDGVYEVGGTFWQIRVHPKTGEQCYIVDSSTDPAKMSDPFLRDILYALIERKALIQSEPNSN